MKQPKNTLDILYYYLSSDDDTSEHHDVLDEWTTKVLQSGDHGFDRGVLGLGWLIAFLIDKNYIYADTDEILEDIDDLIYKLTIKEVVAPSINVSVLLHHITYYQQRLQYSSKAHFYRRFTHSECVKLLIDKLNKFLLENDIMNSVDTISNKINVLLKYSYLIDTCINETLAEKAFYPAIEGLLDFFERQDNVIVFNEQLAQLFITAKQFGNPYWVDRVVSIYANAGIESGQTADQQDLLLWDNTYINHPNKGILLEKDISSVSDEDKYSLYLYYTNIKSDVEEGQSMPLI